MHLSKHSALLCMSIVGISDFMNFFGKFMNKIISLHEQLEN